MFGAHVFGGGYFGQGPPGIVATLEPSIRLQLAGTYEPTIEVPGSYDQTVEVPATYEPVITLSGSQD